MVFKISLCLLIFSCVAAATKSSELQCDGTVKYLGEDDWEVILKGKWVVKFFAPWCPACQSFKPEWEELAKRLHKDGFCVASADVSLNAGLSGRFFVTSLPTFYLIRDGEIRMYNGVRSKEGLTQFVLEDKWMDTSVVPWYISPTSYHMGALAMFFRFSMALRHFHTYITESVGVPVWISYIAFAVVTILVGLALGLFIVFLCDVGFGPADRKKRVDPFGMETNVEDLEEDVIDDNNGEVRGLRSDDNDDNDDEDGDDDNDDEEEEDDDDDNDDDDDEEELEGEADDEEDEDEVKVDEGSGEPRRRKKTTDGDDDDDEDGDDDDAKNEENDKKK